MFSRRRRILALSAAVTAVTTAAARAQLTGETGAHDPSTLIKDGTKYYYFATGQGVVSRSSTNKTSWTAGPSVFGSPPAWTTSAVPGFAGTFWAPDVVFRNNQYYLYYSVSTWGSKTSAIGVATSPTLDPTSAGYGWTDQGAVIQSGNATNYNAIDPSIFHDSTTGRMWMSFGSYWNGIFVTELDPSTGKRLSGSPTINVASGPGTAVEASALVQHGGYYYLFVNWNQCCNGINSTYEIRVGRSASPTGPFLDKNGVNLLSGGGSLFLDDDGKMIGPGHFSLFTENGQDSFGYHYYNGDANGAATYGLRNLYWTSDNWPSYAAVNPDWTGATSGNWSAGTNWGVGGVPNGVGHVANFSANSFNRYSVSLDGSGKTVSTVNFSGTASYTVGATNGNTLTLDAAAGDSATINVRAGTHTIAAPVNAVDWLGVNTSPSTRLNLNGPVSGTGLTKYGHGTVAINGTANFSQSVLARWGFLEVNGAVTANAYTSLGPNAGEGGVMVLRGSGSFTANADLNVGDTGNADDAATGWLEIHDNASVIVNSAGGFFVGSGYFANTQAVGTVTHDGGTLTANGNFDGAFIIGGRNSALGSGTYNLSGAGVVNANTNVRVGGRGTGTVVQTGGTFNATGYVSVGRFAGASGAYNISGGTLKQSGTTSFLIVGEQGAGTLSVSGGGLVSLASALRVGYSTGGAGTVNLDGGTLLTPGVVRGSGTATFNFNGGTLKAAAGTVSFMQGLSAARVLSGGAVFDINGFDVTVAQPLTSPTGSTGGITKNGSGTLKLSAATNAVAGPLTVSAGTLQLPAGRDKVLRVGGTGTVTVAGGAKLDLADNRLIVTGGAAASQWNGTAYGGVAGLIASGGIVTSSATSRLTALAFAAAQDVNRAGGTFAGQSVSAGDLLVLYTYAGDADLNGKLDGDDYFRIDSNFGTSSPNWSKGDFNYDGRVNGDDYFILDSNLGRQTLGQFNAATPAGAADFGTTAVPEPGALSVAAVAGALALRRRRRSDKRIPSAGRVPPIDPVRFGLGDLVEAGAKWMGMDKFAAWYERVSGRPCGCEARKTLLNRVTLWHVSS
jgi:arabinan endo-1,5-alpha-L-arabinosidase